MAACLLSRSTLRTESAALVPAALGAAVAADAIEVTPVGRILSGSELRTPAATVTLAPKAQASASTVETRRRVDMSPPVERPIRRSEA
jgi:hypothetical protein